jgi:hypothetical protein
MSKKTALLVTLILFVIVAPAVAAPTNAHQARTIVQAWLNADGRPLGAYMGSGILNVQTFSGDDGRPAYYAVYLQPSGFVIVPADNMVEPIICFADDGTYNPSSDNPLGALVSHDLPNRIAAARNLQTAQAQAQSLNQQQQIFQELSAEAQFKWNELLTMAGSPSLLGISSVSEVWVAPLVQSTWGQTDLYWCTPPAPTCYNYSTPGNYPCGCVATAMAQLMRYHQQPPTYVWSDMPLQPGCSITLTQRQAIGDLCYYAAESVDTVYDPNGSQASISKVRQALPDVFGYNNAIHAWDNNNDISSGLTNIINPNLDAGKPVILGIFKDPNEHAVLVDGYGYDLSTLYHHINMGWDGYEDAWYNLPNIDCSPPGPYDSILECIYNIFYDVSGEIISGRVTDQATGTPIVDAEVTAVRSGGGTYDTTTNSNGIYAFWGIPSASTYTVSVTKEGYTFTPSNQEVSTGTSTNEQAASGNQWGIDFEGLAISSGGYCPAYSETCDEYISKVQIGDINNISGCDRYADYTDISTLICGTSSYIKVINGNDGISGDKCGVWIDWNQDKVFDSNNEMVLNSSGTGPYQADITVPADANEGYTRMRIRIQWSGTLNPCGVTDYGEVEDYNLIVTHPCDCNLVNIGTGDIDFQYPMHTHSYDSRTQVIYHADEIGLAGTITALVLDVATVPGLTMNNWTIRMKHTPLSSYPNNDLNNADWTTVYQANETIKDIGWIKFDFTTPFDYNDSNNLLVDFSHNNDDDSTNGLCKAWDSEETRTLFAYSDNKNGDPLDWSDSSNPTVYGSDNVPYLKLIVCTEGQEHTLIVTSSNPDSGVPVTMTPADSNGDSDGVTPFTRTYGHYTHVTLTAPVTADGNSFKQWQLNGGYRSNTLDTVVTMDANHTLTAVYEQILVSPMTTDLNGNGIPDFSDFSDFAQSWADDSCPPPMWCQGRDFNHSGAVDMNDLKILCDFWLWPVADINLDTKVNFIDYAILCGLWGQTSCEFPDWCNGCDLDKSHIVDINDLAQMTEYWLFGD